MRNQTIIKNISHAIYKINKQLLTFEGSNTIYAPNAQLLPVLLLSSYCEFKYRYSKLFGLLIANKF